MREELIELGAPREQQRRLLAVRRGLQLHAEGLRLLPDEVLEGPSAPFVVNHERVFDVDAVDDAAAVAALVVPLRALHALIGAA